MKIYSAMELVPLINKACNIGTLTPVQRSIENIDDITLIIILSRLLSRYVEFDFIDNGKEWCFVRHIGDILEYKNSPWAIWDIIHEHLDDFSRHLLTTKCGQVIDWVGMIKIFLYSGKEKARIFRKELKMVIRSAQIPY